MVRTRFKTWCHGMCDPIPIGPTGFSSSQTDEHLRRRGADRRLIAHIAKFPARCPIMGKSRGIAGGRHRGSWRRPNLKESCPPSRHLEALFGALPMSRRLGTSRPGSIFWACRSVGRSTGYRGITRLPPRPGSAVKATLLTAQRSKSSKWTSKPERISSRHWSPHSD